MCAAGEFMKVIPFDDEKLINACKELYLKYLGKKHRLIEQEIRAAGWPTFSRSCLYTKNVRGVEYTGWVEQFGWKKEVKQMLVKVAERAAGRTTFEDWLSADPTGLKWTARHHEFICDHLRRITDGSAKRLMIFVPPRHGKSELVTVRYVAWRLIRDARMNVIIGCYNQRLANRFSRKIKQVTEGLLVRSKSKRATEEWDTAAGGSVKAVGVGSGITGFGGDLIIIDDPVKGRAIANSANFRDKLWDWYKDDVHTRLEPGAAVILIQTRWHDDDLAGRLLKDMEDGGEYWDVVRLPALAEVEEKGSGGVEEIGRTTSASTLSFLRSSAPQLPDFHDPLGRNPGEALWPERFDRDTLLATKRRQGAWSFAALYQQRPLPEGGTLFKAEQFKTIVSKAPRGLRWARGYDLAVSLKNSADYTASFRCAIDERTGTLYIDGGFRKRIEYPEQKRYVVERMNAEPDTIHGIELALHGKALIQELRRAPEIFGRVLRGVKVDVDKLMRAEAWSSYADEGKIALVNGPWINDFVEEACRFTGRGDKHDDQVDAVSLAVRMLRKGSKSHGF